MKYLFIDIKCANLYLRICEFGYVLTDDNFNIIEQKAIPMKPGRPTSQTGKFKRSIHKKMIQNLNGHILLMIIIDVLNFVITTNL